MCNKSMENKAESIPPKAETLVLKRLPKISEHRSKDYPWSDRWQLILVFKQSGIHEPSSIFKNYA